MHELIKECLDDATEVYEIFDSGIGGRVVDQKIFSDLVIMECARVIQDFVDHRFPASEYPNRLKKYFGIESEF